MALVSVSSKCFKAVETALESVKNGNICRSKIVLESIKQDGLLLQQEASALYNRLRQAENAYQQQVEDLTQQMNELYQEQTHYEKQKQELERIKSSLTNEKKRCSQSKQVALRRYQEAREEQREAQSKYDSFKYFWWVPVVGWILVVRELIQENKDKANAARREMVRYDNDIQRADSDIQWAKAGIFQVSTLKRFKIAPN